MLLKLEVPNRGAVPARTWMSVLVGLLLGAGAIGYWIGNGTTTQNAVSHVADQEGRCVQTVTALKIEQSSTAESLHHRVPHSPSK